jgi:putative MATE family efflux protein
MTEPWQVRDKKSVDRQIMGYALSIFGQIIVSPLMLASDTVIVGHILGTLDLAAMTIGVSVVQAIVGIFIFMVFITNAEVSRLIGSGRRQEGVRFGIDSLALAFVLGSVVLAVTLLSSSSFVGFFGADVQIAKSAEEYIRAACLGFPATLMIMACTGILRGLKRLKLPIYVAVCGAVLNVLLNILFTAGLGMGIAGTGYATATTSWLMALVLTGAVLTQRSAETNARPSVSGMVGSMKKGVPVLIRTVLLWVAILAQAHFINNYSVQAVAAMQILITIWGFTQFTTDAIAEAINTLIAGSLGAGEVQEAQFTARRAVTLGHKLAAVMIVLELAGAYFLPMVFTTDPQVQFYGTLGVVVSAAFLLVSNYTYIVDGVQFASGDTKFMALSALVSVTLYVAVGALVTSNIHDAFWGFVALSFCYCLVFIGTRALFSYYRMRTRWSAEF